MSQTDTQSIMAGVRVQETPPDQVAGSGVAISSTVLMDGRREITILHAGERYRLRVTANDRLILTK